MRARPAVDPDEWPSTACRAAGRNLTRAEWTEYLGGDETYRPTCPEWDPDASRTAQRSLTVVWVVGHMRRTGDATLVRLPAMSMPPPPPPATGPSYGGGYAHPHPRGTTVLVLGILSLFCFGVVLGPIAAIMGKNTLDEIDANPQAYTNRSQVLAGMICGIIGFVLSIIGFIIVATN
jgi:Domain of unknown function (DUF4190)